MNKEWSELNKTMQYQIKKRDTWHDGVITLINLRNQLSDTLFFFKRMKSPIITTGNELIKEQISED